MFTGIIEETGTVKNLARNGTSTSLTIAGNVIFGDLKIGDSVAANGVCLTARTIAAQTFTADVMNETLARSSLGALRSGSRVNLERALALNGRLGGHIVTGHIDGTGVIANVERDANAFWFTVRADKKLLRYIVEKGSVALDGISLTVASVGADSFRVSVIPHTLDVTALADRKSGDTLNIENDVLGKYVERLLGGADERINADGGIMSLLAKSGFLEV